MSDECRYHKESQSHGSRWFCKNILGNSHKRELTEENAEKKIDEGFEETWIEKEDMILEEQIETLRLQLIELDLKIVNLEAQTKAIWSTMAASFCCNIS